MNETAPSGMRLVVIGGVTAAFAIAVGGGYGLGWQWTGFQDNNSLWDWLQLLVLPVVLAVLPLWYRTHKRLEVEWRIAGIVLAVAAAVVLFGGYVLDWDWTGFQGNTLWDWIHLLLVPFLVPAALVWMTVPRPEPVRS